MPRPTTIDEQRALCIGRHNQPGLARYTCVFGSHACVQFCLNCMLPLGHVDGGPASCTDGAGVRRTD